MLETAPYRFCFLVVYPGLDRLARQSKLDESAGRILTHHLNRRCTVEILCATMYKTSQLTVSVLIISSLATAAAYLVHRYFEHAPARLDGIALSPLISLLAFIATSNLILHLRDTMLR
ncbi:unnamed protein product, partial [Nesidiocoris tenuis]